MDIQPHLHVSLYSQWSTPASQITNPKWYVVHIDMNAVYITCALFDHSCLVSITGTVEEVLMLLQLKM